MSATPTLEDVIDRLQTLESTVAELEHSKKLLATQLTGLVTQLRELSNKHIDEGTYRTRIWDIKTALKDIT